jgi:hypothetical protein
MCMCVCVCMCMCVCIYIKEALGRTSGSTANRYVYVCMYTVRVCVLGAYGVYIRTQDALYTYIYISVAVYVCV